MGGHGHHEPPYKIPDYRIYQVKDAPKLLLVQRALAAQGLKDPWLRNEVWRHNVKEFGTGVYRLRTSVLWGFRLGFSAFLITIAGTALYDNMYPPKEHGHGHDHH